MFFVFYIIAFVFIIFIICVLRINFFCRIGKAGERRVIKKLKKLDSTSFKILNDILIKIDDKTLQIDHIVISCSGIFVIETKTYSGWIFGNENQEYWTSVNYSRKYKFYNPIKQNNAHIKALKKLLSNIENISFFSVIVFAGSGELKEISANTPVLYKNQLVQFILDTSIAKNLTEQQMNLIFTTVNSNNINSKENLKKHISEVNERNLLREKEKENLICPKCHSNLILRDGKYGQFYGCSRYPSCKYTLTSKSLYAKHSAD